MSFLKWHLQFLILLLGAVSFASANNTCALNVGTAAHYTFSTTVASDWTNCGGTTPQSGDNISITGTAHSFKLDEAWTFGNGQNPVAGYLATITGSAGGSTCASPGSGYSIGGSLAASGNHSGFIDCHNVAGSCTPYIYDRGAYGGTGTTNISAICSGGSPSFTLNWNAGGGTPAIESATQTNIIIAAAIVARGDVMGYDTHGEPSAFITFTSGGKLTFDFSLSGATTPSYTVGSLGTSDAWSRAVVTDGTCTPATCGIFATGGGSWKFDSNGDNTGPLVNISGMTLSHGGDASTPWMVMVLNGNNGQQFGGLTLANSVVTNCSIADVPLNSGYSGEILNVSNTLFTSSIASLQATHTGTNVSNFETDTGSSWDSTGTRIFANNSSDIALFVAGDVIGLTVTGNFFSGNLNSVTDRATPWVANNNFWLGNSATNNGNSFSVPGDFTHSIVYNTGPTNDWHVMLDNGTQRNAVQNFNVFGTETPNTGEAGYISQVPQSSSYTQTFDYNIVLPAPDAHTWTHPGGSSGRPGFQILDHNYWYADDGASAATRGFVQFDEGVVSHANQGAGILTSMRCNTMWNPVDTSSFVKINDLLSTPTMTDTAASGYLDYNWGRGSATTQTNTCTTCTNQTNGYVSAFSSGNVPGVHDNNAVDPGIAYQRVIEAFASDYLGFTPTKGTWSSSATYAQGDTVYASVSGFYWSKMLVYACYAPAGCTSAPQPGGSGNWYSYWEPYTLTWLKTNVPAGTTLVDGALQVFGIGEDSACTTSSPCDPITALRHWIFAGQVPSNVAFWGACAMDNTAIGPVDGKLNRKSIPAVTVN